MNYLNISHCNQVNGDGLRSVIWVAGCDRKCPGCFSEHTHDFKAGLKFTDNAKNELFNKSHLDWCSGITILGGEPLHLHNRTEVISLAKEYKDKFPTKTIWLYSGYTYDEIINDDTMSPILNYIDVLCAGPYIQELRDLNKPWVGSSNQEVINIKRRIEQVSHIKR